jgi:hypothetical protein
MASISAAEVVLVVVESAGVVVVTSVVFSCEQEASDKAVEATTKARKFFMVLWERGE